MGRDLWQVWKYFVVLDLWRIRKKRLNVSNILSPNPRFANSEGANLGQAHYEQSERL